jgi:hypothetical protein
MSTRAVLRLSRGHAGWELAAASLVAVAALGACSAAPPGEAVGTSSAALTGNDMTAYEFFVAKGLTSYQAAGIVGNLDQESGMDPTISQYGGGPGRGIAQWSAGGRWDTDSNDNVEWYAAKEGESATSLELQLQFIWYELTTFSGYGLSELRASTNVSAATIAFETYYEGCGECDQSNRIAYAQAALNAYGSTPPPPPAPRGYLDSATCTAVAGWTELAATPSDTLFADIYYNGAAGSAGASGFRNTAGNNRADLCTAIGSCDHGFSMPTPRGVMDGAAHTVYAYGVNPVAGGANTLLSGSPKSVTCAPPAIAAGSVKRHVTSPTILTDWSFNTFLDMAPYDAAQIAAIADGVDLGQPPDLVQVSGDPAVYIVDGTYRRHVINPTSFAAWRFTSADIKAITASTLAALTDGPDWAAAPLLVKDPSAPAVYMLDVPLPRPPAPDAGTDDAGALNDGGAIVFADGGVVSEGGIIQVPVPITDGGPVARMRPDSGTREADASNEEGDAGSAGGAPGSTGGCSVSAGFQAEDPTSVALFFLTGFVTAARRRRARAIA